jgi:hypothetical protein
MEGIKEKQTKEKQTMENEIEKKMDDEGEWDMRKDYERGSLLQLRNRFLQKKKEKENGKGEEMRKLDEGEMRKRGEKMGSEIEGEKRNEEELEVRKDYERGSLLQLRKRSLERKKKKENEREMEVRYLEMMGKEEEMERENAENDGEMGEERDEKEEGILSEVSQGEEKGEIPDLEIEDEKEKENVGELKFKNAEIDGDGEKEEDGKKREDLIEVLQNMPTLERENGEEKENERELDEGKGSSEKVRVIPIWEEEMIEMDVTEENDHVPGDFASPRGTLYRDFPDLKGQRGGCGNLLRPPLHDSPKFSSSVGLFLLLYDGGSEESICVGGEACSILGRARKSKPGARYDLLSTTLFSPHKDDGDMVRNLWGREWCLLGADANFIWDRGGVRAA